MGNLVVGSDVNGNTVAGMVVSAADSGRTDASGHTVVVRSAKTGDVVGLDATTIYRPAEALETVQKKYRE